MKRIVILFVLLCFPLFLHGGEVYQWVDDRGVTHFTDDPGAVPDDYRNAAEVRGMPEGSPTGSLDNFAEEEDEGILIEDDLKEKDEEWWRSRTEKWRGRLQSAYDDYEQVRLRYNSMATEFNASKDPDKREKLKTELDEMQVEMKGFMADIKRLKEMIEEVLPAQAKKAGKPLEWVR